MMFKFHVLSAKVNRWGTWSGLENHMAGVLVGMAEKLGLAGTVHWSA